MSLSGAMNSAVSALNAQSTALSVISSNVANSSTVGYKAASTSFSSLVADSTGSASVNSYGGVSASVVQNIGVAGLLTSTSNATDLAISGSGFFPITDGVDGDVTYYTRDGEFSVDDEGYLVNGDYYLVGWTTDGDGNVTTANTNSADALEPINLNRYNSTAAATTEVDLNANLPADAAVGDTFTTSLDVYDALGTAQSVPVTWTKAAENTWTMVLGDPTDPSTGAASGTIGGVTSYTVTFGGDGTLAGITDDAGTAVDDVAITVDSWNSGATSSDITLALGTVGSADGLTQYSSGDSDPQVDIDSITKDGVEYGTLSGVEITDDGTVVAKYSNGQELPIYKIPIATFANENGLTLGSGGVYEETRDSGDYTLHVAGSNGAGSIASYSVEGSTTDTTVEMSKMIVAQQAYSAASQLITTSKEMFDTLLQSVR